MDVCQCLHYVQHYANYQIFVLYKFKWIIVIDLSSILQHSEDYSVLFEDTSYQNGYSPPLFVSQRFVITCKDDKKK